MTPVETGQSMLPLLIMVVGFIGLMYFFGIRPMQKQAKQQQELLQQIVPGDRVVLTSGIFGTIKYVGERQIVVELAPGLEITALTQAIRGKVRPEDEEFEYESETIPASAEVLEQSEDQTSDTFQEKDGLETDEPETNI